VNFRIAIFLIVTLSPISIIAQDFNTIITDEKSGKPMLIGYTTIEAFSDTSFSVWWDSEYNMYDVDSSAVVELQEILKDVQIQIVSGTWCSDSRRELPRFFKILDVIQYPLESVTMISVNREKVGLNDEVDEMQIDFVPTFIFSKNDKELGRIIEMPYDSLEKDMLEFLIKNVP
jgi:hypothetical protein